MLEHQIANGSEQLIQVQQRGCLAGNGVNGFKLRRPPLLERVEARIFNGDGSLRRKQREQVEGFSVEVVEFVALNIQNSNHLIANHERDGKFGFRIRKIRDVMGISAYIGDVKRPLPACRLSDDPIAGGQREIRLKAADL